MVDHKIPLIKVRARLLYRTGETVLQHAYARAIAQEVRAQAIPDPTNLVMRTWTAGGSFARGIHLGGTTAPLSEPCHA